MERRSPSILEGLLDPNGRRVVIRIVTFRPVQALFALWPTELIIIKPHLVCSRCPVFVRLTRVHDARPPSVLETWKSEFDVLIAEDPMMIFAMPPQLIGQASRFAVLEGLIKHALSRSNVWTGRCDEISDPLRPCTFLPRFLVMASRDTRSGA
jgi:hypothetical protein